MRRRLYFLLPTAARARQVVDELLLARIDDHHIHVMAKEGIPLGDLPQANVLQRSDLIHGIGVGLGVGGATGILTGLVAIAFPPEGITLGGWTLLVTALAGALIGAWVAGMIGTDIPNSQLREFATAVVVYGGKTTTVGTVILNYYAIANYPFAAVNALMLMLAMMIGVGIIMRLVNIRKEL